MTDRPLRVAEAADQLAVSESTVWREIRAGHIRTIKIRGARRITPREVAAYLAHLEGRRVA